MVIPPLYEDIYRYKIIEDEETTTVNIKYHASLKPEAMTLLFDHSQEMTGDAPPDHLNIELYFDESLPPVFAGKLYAPVTTAKLQYNDENNTFSLLLKKEEPLKWPTPIVGAHERFQAIDPKSAYRLYKVLMYQLSSDPQQEHAQQKELTARQLLASAVEVGYLPAMRSLVQILLGNPEARNQALSLLAECAHKYHDPFSLCQLGTIHLHIPGHVEKGFVELSEAAKLGNVDALMMMALCLSPFSNHYFPQKDAEAAIHAFEQVLEKRKSPTALHEMAMIYFRGAPDVPLDIEKANRLQQQAIEENNALPKERREEFPISLNTIPAPVNEYAHMTPADVEKAQIENQQQQQNQETNEEESPLTTAFLIVATVGFVIGVGFSIYKKLKGKK